MKKRVYFSVALICTMLLGSCKQPPNESKEVSIVLEKDQIFLNPSPTMARSSQKVIQITTSKNIALPLTISDYDPTLMTAAISDDNQSIIITALKDSKQEIFIIDQAGNRSKPLRVVINSLDLELSIAMPPSTVKVGQKFDLTINKGIDVGILNVSSSDHLSTTLTDSTISIEVLKDGLASITITDGVVSERISFAVEPLDKSLSISPEDSDLKVNHSRIYTIHQGIDGGELEITIVNDGVVQIDAITEKVSRATELKNDREFKITGLKHGRATITLTDKSDPTIKVTATITVKALDHTLELDAPTTTVAMTKTANVAVKKGEDIDRADLVIESSNESVATAQFTDNKQNVVVTGKSVGKATISIRDKKNNLSYSVEMTVRALDLNFTITESNPPSTTNQNKPLTLLLSGGFSGKELNIKKGSDVGDTFRVEFTHPNIVRASIDYDTNSVILMSLARGETSIVLIDSNGVRSNSIAISVLDATITHDLTQVTLKIGERVMITRIRSGEDANAINLSFNAGNNALVTMSVDDQAERAILIGKSVGTTTFFSHNKDTGNVATGKSDRYFSTTVIVTN